MESDLHIRVKVHELLCTSLKAEHFQEIRGIHPDYSHVDYGDADNLLYYLEKEKQCISMKNYYELIVLLNQIDLGEVAKEILSFHEIPEEKYIALKNKIEEIFKDRKYKMGCMGQFKNRIIDCYKLKSDDIKHLDVEDIIEDLEERHLLSRSSSDVLRFRNVFNSCGCKNVVELIKSMENVMVIKEETPMDTSDAGAASITFQQHRHPSQSTQEQNPGSSEQTTGQHLSTFSPACGQWQNPGSSEPTTGRHPSTFSPASAQWQNPGSSEPTTGRHPSTFSPASAQWQNPGSSEPTTGRHPSTFSPACGQWQNPGSSEPTGRHPSTFSPASAQWQNPGSSEPTTGRHPSTFSPASSHWQNPGIGESTGGGYQSSRRRTWQGSNTEAFPTAGDQFRRRTLQGPAETFRTAGQNVGSGFQSANPHTHSPYHQPHSQRQMQEYQGPACTFNTSNVGLNINIGTGANIGQLYAPAGNTGQCVYGWNHGQGGQGIHGHVHGQGYHGQGDPGRSIHEQGAHQYFPRQ